MALTGKEKYAKKKWLTALRSGAYKQGRGVLYCPQRKAFCCLGVLEHVMLGGKVEHEETGQGIEFKEAPSCDFYKTFPQLAWVGDNEDKLIDMNDDRGCTFVEIADYIEKKWT